MPPGADAPPESEDDVERVEPHPAERAVRGQEAVGVERVRVRVGLRVVEDRPGEV